MKKTLWMALFLAASFLSQDNPTQVPAMTTAIAKPPDWAPAHGYRRKHKDKDKHHDHDHDYDRDDEVRRIVITRYEEVFRVLDINRDGRITRIEWQEGDSLFDRLDRNNDGYLSRWEYERVDEERGFISGLVSKVKQSLASLWDKLW